MWIVVVEDDEEVSEVLETALHLMGGWDRITVFASTETAALFLTDRPGSPAPPDFILSDVDAPLRDSGLELIRDLHQLFPTTKLALMTGRDAREVARRLDMAFVPVFQKPFALEALELWLQQGPQLAVLAQAGAL